MNRFYGSFGTPLLPPFYFQEGKDSSLLVFFSPPKRGKKLSFDFCGIVMDSNYRGR
jgi:hypothetical protein